MDKKISELEKALYNKHLAVSRSLKNKPFKIRKDFNGFELSEDKKNQLRRLANLAKKHPEIDFDVFFQAPYKLYPDVEYFGLDYFSTLRAIKSYTLYKQSLFLQDPDSQIDDVKKSLRFIAKFCVDNNLFLHQYPNHKTADFYTWMIHYKENKINVYCLMEFRDLFSAIQQLPEDITNMFVKNFSEKFKELYIAYNTSKNLKPFLKQAFNKLNNFVSNELTNKQNNR